MVPLDDGLDGLEGLGARLDERVGEAAQDVREQLVDGAVQRAPRGQRPRRLDGPQAARSDGGPGQVCTDRSSVSGLAGVARGTVQHGPVGRGAHRDGGLGPAVPAIEQVEPADGHGGGHVRGLLSRLVRELRNVKPVRMLVFEGA